jgi:hypothetical protein
MADSGAAADFSTNVVDVASHETRPNCGGDLVRLKTDAEMRARDDTRRSAKLCRQRLTPDAVEIYVAEILSKHTKLALEYVSLRFGRMRDANFLDRSNFLFQTSRESA